MTKELPAHAVIRPLNVNDLAQVLALEQEAFDEGKRATEEKLKYRLKTCPELCFGVFITSYESVVELRRQEKRQLRQAAKLKKQRQLQNSLNGELPTDNDDDEDDDDYNNGNYDDTDDEESTANSSTSDLNSRNGSSYAAMSAFGRGSGFANRMKNIPLPPGKSTIRSERLVGHFIATKTLSFRVTDSAMQVPELDSYGRKLPTSFNEPLGHAEAGRTICLHSLAITQEYRGKNIASILLKECLERFATQSMADRVALLSKDDLVPFYARLGFVDNGLSESKFGNVSWRDLSCSLTNYNDEEDM
ncbi:acyl-CoA N-acyltransferase [Nadsonia fulvescens var. elongata DSM 6958]|uniref:Acyl-CoA N-acyltransferase n=1 Tax=Nadsonia fulvescens var. elongata DSM 6958 TaxID=857566 RepID=A0A1E3PE75_9ASCO|nr:acyl-CoA N-acyltransferase [Nadsonia fulvescens var. elongata DSM 6958]